MSEARPVIRTLTLAETGELIDWAAGEGWNPGAHSMITEYWFRSL